jgi:hypothetical protein
MLTERDWHLQQRQARLEKARAELEMAVLALSSSPLEQRLPLAYEAVQRATALLDAELEELARETGVPVKW